MPEILIKVLIYDEELDMHRKAARRLVLNGSLTITHAWNRLNVHRMTIRYLEVRRKWRKRLIDRYLLILLTSVGVNPQIQKEGSEKYCRSITRDGRIVGPKLRSITRDGWLRKNLKTKQNKKSWEKKDVRGLRLP